MITDYGQNARKLQHYVDALEKERRKIEVFQRELPLCMQLVTHAIETCKQQMASEILFSGRSDSSSEGPVLEEFIPLKRSSSPEEEGDEHRRDRDERPASKKPDWLKSVQLWTQDNDPPSKEERRSLIEPKKSNGAFQPFCKEDRRAKVAAAALSATATSSTSESGGRDDKEAQAAQRKARRCWSPELHRRFLHALEQLGGSYAATPKQIRELMKVDGLTNDEVKSHLQKYRLHTRRPSPTVQSNSNTQTPQFVVVGGIWVPPPDYAAAAGQPAEPASGQTREIYAPTATFPQARQHEENKLHRPSHSDGRCSDERHSMGNGNASSHSPANSTTSHVTTTSPSLVLAK